MSHTTLDGTTPKLKFRAQVRAQNSSRWVDGGLFIVRRHAERDAERLSVRYGADSRVVVA